MTCILVSRSIGGVFVDVVVSENHEAEIEIPKHPVEKGAKISDHAWRLGYKVTLESVVAGPRAMAAYQQLLDVQAKLEPFTLVTGLRVYNDMMLVRLNPERDSQHSRVLKFTADLEEVRIVNTETSASGGSSSDDKAQGTTKRGQVAARRADTIPGRTDKILSDAIAVD